MSLLRRIIGSIFGRTRSIYYLSRYHEYRKKYHISESFLFQGTDIRLYGDGTIILEDNSYLGTNSTIQAAKDQTVKLGKMCQVSHNVRIYTSSADPNQDFRKPKTKPHIVGDVLIGDGVWIGANVFINPGIKIGDNSVIGANSVVTKNVEPDTIVGGVPAKLISHKN